MLQLLLDKDANIIMLVIIIIVMSNNVNNINLNAKCHYTYIIM